MKRYILLILAGLWLVTPSLEASETSTRQRGQGRVESRSVTAPAAPQVYTVESRSVTAPAAPQVYTVGSRSVTSPATSTTSRQAIEDIESGGFGFFSGSPFGGGTQDVVERVYVAKKPRTIYVERPRTTVTTSTPIKKKKTAITFGRTVQITKKCTIDDKGRLLCPAGAYIFK